MNKTLLFNSTNGTYSSGSLPVFFPTGYRTVATILQVLIFCLGFIGNIATIHVVRKTKSLQTPTYCYLVSLAIADLMVLISAVPEAIISNYLYKGQWVLGQAGCSILVFVNFLGINASSTSICCFTVERYIGICHPLWAQKFCSVQRAKKIITGIWVFAILYCSHWLGLTLIKTHRFPGFPELQSCSFRLPREAYVYFFLADICLFYLIPLIVAIILYTRIGLVLKKSTRSDLRKNLATIKSGLSAVVSGEAVPPSPVHQKDNPLFQVVRMLIVIVTSFAILWLPYRGLLVYNSFSSNKFLDIWYLLFAKTAIYLNSAINPVLYSILSKKFREALLVHILLCYEKSDDRTLSGDSATRTSFVTCGSRFNQSPANKKDSSGGSNNSSMRQQCDGQSTTIPPVENPEGVPLLFKDSNEWNKTIIFV